MMSAGVDAIHAKLSPSARWPVRAATPTSRNGTEIRKPQGADSPMPRTTERSVCTPLLYTRDAVMIPLPPSRVLTRPWERAAYSADASFYTLTPQAVVRPVDTREVAALFAWSRESRVPLAFRAAGTSLSGQAVTDRVLLDVARHRRLREVSC